MPALTTDFRDTLATALAGVSGNVYATAPAAPVPPAVVIVADNPWMTPAVMGGRLRTEVRLRVMCAVRDSGDNLAQLESLVESALVALPDGAVVSEVTAPQSLDAGPQGTLLTSEIRLSVHLREA